VNGDAEPIGCKMNVMVGNHRKTLVFENLSYSWSGDESTWEGNSTLSFEGEFSHQRMTRTRGQIDCLVAESWLNSYHLSLAGVIDLALESGSENYFRVKLLSHMCFLTLNANLQLDPLSIVQKSVYIAQLKSECAIPQHKLWMATDLLRGQSMGRIYVDLQPISKLAGDLTDYDQFKVYVNDCSNGFHLSPIEHFMKDHPEFDLFRRI
jgi:hypothetical protein